MASQSVLELAVNTGKWDSGLKKAKTALDNFTTASGGLQQALGKDSEKMQKFVQMMGGMESKAKTAKGQMNDYKSTIEQLTMQYNRMSDAQKKTIGQDYLNAIDQIRQKYRAVANEMQEINRSMSIPQVKPVGSDKISGAMQVFKGNLYTKAAEAAMALANRVGDIVSESVEMAKAGEGVRIAFERLGRGDILDGLRQATHGTVTDLELMKAAVKFNDFRLPLNELGTMLAFAQQKAKDTGQSVDYMVDSIVTGLGRKSLMILDNLGLSANEVKEKMKQTGDMTKAVGEIIREQMAKSGDYVETAADRALQSEVRLKNEMDGLGRTLMPLSDRFNSMFSSAESSAVHFIDVGITPLVPLLESVLDTGTKAFSSLSSTIATVADNTLRLMGPLGKLYAAYSDMVKMNIAMEALGSGADIGGLLGNLLADKQQDQLDFSDEPTTKNKVQGGLKGVNMMRGVGINTYSSIASIRQQLNQQQNALNNATNMVDESLARSRINELSWQLSDEGRQAAKLGMEREDVKMLAEEMGKAIGNIEGLDIKPTERSKSKTDVDLLKEMSKTSTGINSIVGGIQQLGIEIPEGLSNLLSGIQGLTNIAQGIMTIVEVIQAIDSADALIPFHTGGTVHASRGYRVPGNYGYDAVPAILTSGETVLTRAQSGNIASQLAERDIAPSVQPYVTGETVFIGMSNHLKQRGMGEIVTTSMLKRLNII